MLPCPRLSGAGVVRNTSSATGGSFYPNGLAVGNGVIVMTGFDEGGGGIFNRGGPSAVLWVGSSES